MRRSLGPDGEDSRVRDAAERFVRRVCRPPPTHRGTRRRRFAKVLLVLTAMLGTLLLLEVWVSDVSGHQSILQGALRGARDVVAGSVGPRFIGSTPVRERALEKLPPLPPPRRFVMRAPLETAMQSAPPAPAPRVDPVPPPIAAAPQRVAIAPVSIQVAPVAEARVGSREIENLVVRLVGYYQAGEADKLMGLIDTREAGYWQSQRMRRAYADFFGATRQRWLRVDDLAWQTADASAQARGRATVMAEYFDVPGLQERRVEMEIDIALRGGHPVITRLSLYPHAR